MNAQELIEKINNNSEEDMEFIEKNINKLFKKNERVYFSHEEIKNIFLEVFIKGVEKGYYLYDMEKTKMEDKNEF